MQKRILLGVAILLFILIIPVVAIPLARSWTLLPEGCPPECLGADLRDKNLISFDLRQANLSGVDMSGANLSEANLSGANLTRASLIKTNLAKANLSGANLKGANLRQAILSMVVLSEADLSGADLTGATLTGVDLTTVNLTAAVLDQTRMIGTNLRGADLSGADLSGANLRGAQLSGANLSGANLSGADLSGARMTGVILRGASLNDATLVGTYLVGSDLNGISMSTSLNGADLSGADLSGANLFGAELAGVKLFGAILTDANLISAKLNGVDLRGTRLDGAKMWVSELSETELELLGKDPEVVIEDVDIHGYDIDDKDIAKASGVISLYTSIPQNIVDKIQADFGAKYPRITLSIFRAGTSSVVEKLMAERRARDVKADLIWVAEPSTYETFKEQGMLLKYTPPESVFMPPEMKDPDGYWNAGRLINMIIGYNTAAKTPPKGWLDLLRPEYQDKLGFVDPEGSSAALSAVKTLLDKYGWKYFEDLRANGCTSEWSNSTASDRLASGEILVGVLLDYYVRGAKEEGRPVEQVWPKEGAVFVPSPIAILNTTRNPLAAKIFVDYVLSKDGQETMVTLGNFIPVRYDVDPPKDTPPLNEIKKLHTDWAALSKEQQEIIDQWITIFGRATEP